MSEPFLRISQAEYTDDETKNMLDFHYHNYYEIYYLISGQRRYLINDNLFDINAGDIVLIKKNELHMTKQLATPFGENMKIYMNDDKIDSLGKNSEIFKECFDYNHIIIPTKQKKHITTIFSKIQKERNNPQLFSEQLINNLIYELLADIYKLIFIEQKDISLNVSEIQSDEINKAIKYIYVNYSKNLSLSEIAKSVNMNSSYFSRYFKKHTGLNLMDYINLIRIKNATSLIKNTNMTLTEIAHVCGYNEQAYFCKQFKRINGCTATEFKKL